MDVDELVQFINEKTDLTVEQAKKAANAATAWFKDAIPDEVAESMGDFFESAGDMAGRAADATGEAAKGMVDKAKGAMGGMMGGDDSQ